MIPVSVYNLNLTFISPSFPLASYLIIRFLSLNRKRRLDFRLDQIIIFQMIPGLFFSFADLKFCIFTFPGCPAQNPDQYKSATTEIACRFWFSAAWSSSGRKRLEGVFTARTGRIFLTAGKCGAKRNPVGNVALFPLP